MQTILSVVQIIVSVGLITTILLQQRDAGSSSIFGGGSSADYRTKRGFEKILFISSIVLAGLFLVSSFLSLLI